ncbi:MAG: sterol desaturase family protein [Bacteroidetes bacterium]|nr:MAG: sterol desaturase family protein [Bacteroidota bacterium]
MDFAEFISFWTHSATRIVSRYFIFAGSAFFIFYVLLKRPLWFRKIQKRMPRLSDYGRDIFYSLITVSIFATVAFVVLFVARPYTNLYKDIATYGTAYYLFTWVWMLFLHDTWFYWMHRLMHHPLLFKHVHLVHHKSTNPSPWTAYAFHPLEALVEVGIVPLIAFTLPVHAPALGLFFLFQIIYNVYGHLGFELYPKNFHKTLIGRWINTSVAHNLHHKRFKGNYGLYFLFWDRLMGTLREDYDSTYEATTQKAPEKMPQTMS